MPRRMAVAVAAVGLLVAGHTAAAAEDTGLTVTVHVEDYARISEQDWARVKEAVGEIFAGVGVSLSWAAALHVPMHDWPQDGVCRVALVIANIEAPFAGTPSDTADVLGRAAPRYSRAWVFANRIASVASTSAVDPTLLLARAIAHEIGHLLLPDEAHSDRGIMKGGLALTSVGFFGFTPRQATVMRERRLLPTRRP